MLQIQNLSIFMKKDFRSLLHDFCFTLGSGERVAVIGEEGNGKSTLLKLIYDPLLLDDYIEYSGIVSRDSLIIGYLPQEISYTERSLTVYELCCKSDAFLNSDYGELASVAARLHIPADMPYGSQPLDTLSGGEKIKLRLLLITLMQPDVILLDEPSNDLDIETLEWLEDFILQSDCPVIFISHDEVLLENTANVIIHLEQLRRKTVPRHTIVRMGYKQYLSHRLCTFEHQEQTARKERELHEKKLAKFDRIYRKVDKDLSSVSRQDPHTGRLLKKKMSSVKSLEKRLGREGEDMTPLPESEDAIMISFPDHICIPQGKTVLELSLPCLSIGDTELCGKIELNIRGPEHICIIGKNAVGKTTLLRRIKDELLLRADIKTAYMPQDFCEGVDMNMTPVEFLTSPMNEGFSHEDVASFSKENVTRAKTYLGSMKYTASECAHSISQLSGGQKAKLFFLKMILSECNVLILDEPTRNFSPMSAPVIRSVLRNFKGAVISISHDRRYVDEVCDRVYELTKSGLTMIR